MNILHLSSEKKWRGGEQQIAYLLQASIEKGLNVRVVCRKGTAFETHCQTDNIPFDSISFNGCSKLTAAWKIKKICQSHSIDLIHAHSSSSHTVAVLSSLLGNPLPIVLSRRVDFTIKQNFFTLWKYNHPSLKKILCVSDAVANIIRPSIKQPEKIATVYDGIDLNRFQPPALKGDFRKDIGINDDALLIGNVAAYTDNKDLFTFLRASAQIYKAHPDARFVIVGEGELRNSLTDAIKRLGLDGIVTLTGFRDDIPSVFKDLDIFLMTSKTEGLGSSIIDAFANKVPVIATAGGGIPELINNEVNGFLAPVGDDTQVAEYVNRLANDRTLGKKYADAAFEIMLGKFTKEVMSEDTIEHYKQALKEGNPT